MNQTEKRVKRVTEMEKNLDDIRAAEQALDAALDAFATVHAKARKLDAYYTGADWRGDYEADEQGLLPPELKRGVLSEDAAYDALADYRRLLIRLLDAARDGLKNGHR